jgi:hypothetical protein
MSTLIYLGMLAVVSSGMFAWGRILFKRVKNEHSVTPPDDGKPTEETSSPVVRAEGRVVDKKSKAAASGLAKSAKREDAAA